MAAYSSSHNFWKPESFVPERWLPVSDNRFPKDAAADRKEVFEPFSTGPKNCIGRNLAYAEMKLILARFLWRFDYRVLDDDFEFERQRVFLFREKPPLKVALSVKGP